MLIYPLYRLVNTAKPIKAGFTQNMNILLLQNRKFSYWPLPGTGSHWLYQMQWTPVLPHQLCAKSICLPFWPHHCHVVREGDLIFHSTRGRCPINAAGSAPQYLSDCTFPSLLHFIRRYIVQIQLTGWIKWHKRLVSLRKAWKYLNSDALISL